MIISFREKIQELVQEQVKVQKKYYNTTARERELGRRSYRQGLVHYKNVAKVKSLVCIWYLSKNVTMKNFY